MPDHEAPLRADAIAVPLVVVDRSTPALDAVRLIADQDLLGLVVSGAGRPWVVVSAVDVVQCMVPEYLRRDVVLANTVGDDGIEDLRSSLEGRSIGDVVDEDSVRTRSVLVVPPDAGLVELCARMVDAKAQIALVDDPSRAEPVFVTLPTLLDTVVARWDSGSEGPGAGR